MEEYKRLQTGMPLTQSVYLLLIRFKEINKALSSRQQLEAQLQENEQVQIV